MLINVSQKNRSMIFLTKYDKKYHRRSKRLKIKKNTGKIEVDIKLELSIFWVVFLVWLLPKVQRKHCESWKVTSGERYECMDWEWVFELLQITLYRKKYIGLQFGSIARDFHFILTLLPHLRHKLLPSQYRGHQYGLLESNQDCLHLAN